jgi:hypothetical protein
MRFLTGAVLVLLSGITTEQASAGVTYGFFSVTQNSGVDSAIGQSQLTLTVSRAKGNRVRFRFDNIGTEASSITDVYFDDRAGLFSGIDRIRNTTGVSFSTGASPGNLPGANNLSPAFQTTLGLSADSDPPVSVNGVNPGEKLVMFLDLTSGKSYSDALAAFSDLSLRVGMHVQAFDSGGSEGFVNTVGGTPPPIVPEPTGLALAGLGIAGLLVRRRRQEANTSEETPAETL